MNTETIKTYFREFCLNQQDDAFHSLIEGGGDVVEELENALSESCSDKEFYCALEVLSSMPNEFSCEKLHPMFTFKDLPKWRAVVDAYCRLDPSNYSQNIIDNLHIITCDDSEKMRYIKEIIDDFV